LRIDESLDRLVGQRLLGDFGDGLSAGTNCALEDALDARAFDGARQDGVDADAELAELDRQRLGEADETPFRRRIGAAIR
jgi:hypothetical protein